MIIKLPGGKKNAEPKQNVGRFNFEHCVLEIEGVHNHGRRSAETLTQLKVIESTKEHFRSYFVQGQYLCIIY